MCPLDKENTISNRAAIIAAATAVFGFLTVYASVKLSSEIAHNKVISRLHEGEMTLKDDSKPNEPPGRRAEAPPIRFAIAPVLSPEISYVSYKNLIDYIANVLGRTGKMVTRNSYAEINDLIRNNQCDVAIICTYSYIEVKNQAGARLLVIPEVNGRITYRSLVIVGMESDIWEIKHLQGRRLGYADALSTSGWVYLALLLRTGGIDPYHFFDKRQWTGSHDSSIFAVVDGTVDAAAVHSLVYDQMPPQTKKQLRIIHSSPEFGMPPFVTPAGVDPDLRQQIQDVLLSMHRDRIGRSILDKIRINQFHLGNHSHYQSVENLVLQWKSK